MRLRGAILEMKKPACVGFSPELQVVEPHSHHESVVLKNAPSACEETAFVRLGAELTLMLTLLLH